MKVDLIKIAEYNFDESKYTRIPFEAFVNMNHLPERDLNKPVDIIPNPMVRIFESLDEFKNAYNWTTESYDEEKGVFLMSNGKFGLFLKENNAYEPTNSKESTGEQPKPVQ